MSLRHNCQMGHHCVYNTFSLRVKKKKKSETRKGNRFSNVYIRYAIRIGVLNSSVNTLPAAGRNVYVWNPSPPLFFVSVCLLVSFFFFSKPTPDEMEIANRVIEFKKKKKNRHITVVLICNSLIFGRLCCLHIFVCLVWCVFVVDLASSCCYLIWGWGYWKYLYYPN